MADSSPSKASDRYEFDAPSHVVDFKQLDSTDVDDTWFGKLQSCRHVIMLSQFWPQHPYCVWLNNNNILSSYTHYTHTVQRESMSIHCFGEAIYMLVHSDHRIHSGHRDNMNFLPKQSVCRINSTAACLTGFHADHQASGEDGHLFTPLRPDNKPSECSEAIRAPVGTVGEDGKFS